MLYSLLSSSRVLGVSDNFLSCIICFSLSFNTLIALLRRALLNKAINVLNDREKHIIQDRKLSETPKTLEELSNEYNISRERIRQIEERAFQKLQTEMLSLARDTKLIQA